MSTSTFSEEVKDYLRRQKNINERKKELELEIKTSVYNKQLIKRLHRFNALIAYRQKLIFWLCGV